MAERKGVDQEMGAGQQEITRFNTEMLESMKYIIQRMRDANDLKEELKEAVKALADKMGCKPAKVSKIIRLVIQEEEKGGVISAETEILELAEQAVQGKTSSS